MASAAAVAAGPADHDRAHAGAVRDERLLQPHGLEGSAPRAPQLGGAGELQQPVPQPGLQGRDGREHPADRVSRARCARPGGGVRVVAGSQVLRPGLVRTLLITPFLLMPVVVGLVWKDQMFHGLYGVLNWIIEKLGGTPVDFVSTHPTLSIIIVLIWQWTPFMMLIMLAGLQSQPSDVLEAAKVDGATPFAIFRQLTLSHLRPYMELGILLGTIYLIQVYDQIAVMTGGGPGSTNLPYFVFERSIGGGWEFGQASAYSIVVVIASIAIATVALRVLSGLLKGEEIA